MLCLLLALLAGVCVQSKTWIWQGALTPTSLEFKLKTDDPNFRLVAVPEDKLHANLTIARYVKDSMFRFPQERIAPKSGWNAQTTRSLHLVLDNLQPNTEYSWSGGVDEVSGRFKTPPAIGTPFNFSFAFGSCADNDSSHAIFDFIPKNRDPLFFVHMGDLHYGNLEVNDVFEFANMFDRTLLGSQSHLYHNMPLVYVWDDHDFGPNNADRSSLSRPAALQAYRTFVPHYPLAPDNETAIFQSFVIGRVLFIVTDTSSQRVVEDKTTLGEVQFNWLIQKLRDLALAKDGVRAGVWVNTFPWIDDHYKWGEFAEERAKIGEMIKALELSNKLIIISGDAHMLAVDDGTNSAGNVKVFHAAAIDAKPTTKGGPYSHGAWPGRNQYGTMTVTDGQREHADEICFKFEGWRFTGPGAEARRLVTFDTCDTSKSSPPRPYTPSPFFMQRQWKRVKKMIEANDAAGGGWLTSMVVWVDSSQFTLATLLDPKNILASLLLGVVGMRILFR